MLRRATGMGRSAATAALGALLGTVHVQNSIIVWTAKVYYRIKEEKIIKLIKDGGPRIS